MRTHRMKQATTALAMLGALAAGIRTAAAPADLDLTGTVLDAGGRPILGARVALVRIDSDAAPAATPGAAPMHRLTELQAVLTSPEGQFTLPHVANGSYELTIVAGTDWLIADQLAIDGTPLLKPIVLQFDGRTRIVSLGPVKAATTPTRP